MQPNYPWLGLGLASHWGHGQATVLPIVGANEPQITDLTSQGQPDLFTGPTPNPYHKHMYPLSLPRQSLTFRQYQCDFTKML